MTHFRFVSSLVVVFCSVLTSCESSSTSPHTIGHVPLINTGGRVIMNRVTTGPETSPPPTLAEAQAFSSATGVDGIHTQGMTGQGSTIAYVTDSGFDAHPEIQTSTAEEYLIEFHARIADGSMVPAMFDPHDYFHPDVVPHIDILRQNEQGFTFLAKMTLDNPHDAGAIGHELKLIVHPSARGPSLVSRGGHGWSEFLAHLHSRHWGLQNAFIEIPLRSFRNQHDYRIVGVTHMNADGTAQMHTQTSLHPESDHHDDIAHVDEDIGIFTMMGGIKDPDRENDKMNTYGMAHGASLRLHTTDPTILYTSAPIAAIKSARGAVDESHIVVLSNRLYRHHYHALSNAVLLSLGPDIAKSHLDHRYGSALQRHRDIISPMLAQDDDGHEDIFILAAMDGRTDHAGNQAMILHYYPQLQERGLVAVAMEEGHTPCGAEAAAFCLAAPGTYKYRSRGEDKVYNTDDDTMNIGVSANAAAAHIAAALALLQEMFDDTISPQELVERIKMTANKEFTGYDPARYGRGVIDLRVASLPVLESADFSPPTNPSCLPDGSQDIVSEVVCTDSPPPTNPLCVPDGLRVIVSGDMCSDDNVEIVDSKGHVITGAIGRLSLGMGFGAALSGGLAFFDALNTPWQADSPYNPYAAVMDLTRMVTTSLSRLSLDERLDALRDGTTPSQQGRWTSGDTAVTLSASNVSTANLEEGRFMLSVEKDKLRLMGMNNVALSYALGLHGDALAGHTSSDEHAFHAPYLALASGGISGGISYDTGKNGRLAFVVGEGTSLNDSTTSLPQSEKARAFAAMMEYAPNRNLMFHAGMLQEDSTLLESDGSGLFDIQGGSTMFFGMQARQRLSANWQVLVSGYGGRTQLDGSQGIISDLDVVTSSFDVGVLGSDVMERGDTLLVRVGQPMRVESGTLDVSYVTSRRQDGSTIATTQSMSVAPPARAIELNLSYEMPIEQGNGHVRFTVSHTINPNHQQAQGETVGLISFQHTF